MLKGFDEIVVVNRTNGLVTSNLKVETDPPTPHTPESPDFTPDGTPIAYVKEPMDNRRHIALGRFMDAWSKLESAIATVLCDSTGLDRKEANVLMNALGTRGQLDVIDVLGGSGLSDAQQAELVALMGRVRTNNTRRNYIVHGNWVLEVRLYNANGKLLVRLHQQRRYPVSDKTVRNALNKPENKRDRLKYVFSIPRIDAITKELEQLKDDISEFNRVRHGLPEGSRRYLVTLQADRRS